MERNDIVLLFGNYSKAAKLLGISRQAVRQWEYPLHVQKRDQVIGCCLRNGVPVPESLMDRFMEKSVA